MQPDKAAKFEARGKLVRPTQWMSAAGWGRLGPLNRALGELIHVRDDSRWSGARGLLTALLPPDEDPTLAPFKARGFALDSIGTLAVQTVLDAVGFHSSVLRDSFLNLMRKGHVLNEESEAELDRWMERTNAQRGFDYGKPDFTDPATETK